MADAGRPDFCFMISPDGQLLLEEISARLEDFLPCEKFVFWGDEPAPARFWDALRQQGLFGGRKAIIVRRAQEWPQPVWRGIDDALKGACAEIWPFFCLESDKGGAAAQKSASMKFAQKKGWVWTAPRLAGANLQKYVEAGARARGLKFAPRAAQIFCRTVQPAASAINNELDRLALVAESGVIEPALARVDAGLGENDAFALIRSLQAGDTGPVWREIVRDSSILFLLLALLAREFRLLWQLCCGEAPPLRPTDAAAKRSLAQRLGKRGISDGFSALADAEWQVKSGRQSPEQALEWLAVSLTRLFGPSR